MERGIAMVKKWKTIGLMWLAAWMCLCLCACTVFGSAAPVPSGGQKFTPEDLTEQELKQLQEAVSRYEQSREKPRAISPDDVIITEYFGNYHGAYVFFHDFKDERYRIVCNAAITPVRIKDFVFVFPSGCIYSVCKDGTLYTLQEAYEKEVLSLEDIEALYNNHYAHYDYLTDQIEKYAKQ